MNRVAKFLDGLLDVIIPRSCLNCGKAVDPGPFRYLCHPCARRVVYAGPPRCDTCGYPIFGAVDSARSCPHCLHLKPHYRMGRTVTLFRGPVRSLIHALKYEQAEYAVGDLVELARQHPDYLDHLKGAHLVPVPLHGRKLRERGYNQSELIAAGLGRLVGEGTRVCRVLERVVDTPSQTRYSRGQRQVNLKNAFALADDAMIIPNQRYVIIDDVFTTGSTLNACADVLRRSGVSQVDVATIGHG